MGCELSKPAVDFVTTFCTAPEVTPEDVEVGTFTLDSAFQSAVTIAAPSPTTTALINDMLEPLFMNAIDNNRIGVALEAARRRLDQVVSNGTEGRAKFRAVCAVRFAQCLITLAIARCEAGPFLLRKLIDDKGAATALHGVAIDYIVADMPVTSPLELRLLAEVQLLLLSMYSTALYHAPDTTMIGGDVKADPHGDYFLDAAATFSDGAMMKLYGASLLRTVCRWGGGDLRTGSWVEYPAASKPSLWNLYNWFGWAKQGDRIDVSTAVGLRALHIFSVLVTYRKPGRPASCMLTQFRSGSQPFGGCAGAPTTLDLLKAAAAKISAHPEMVLLPYLLCCHHRATLKTAITPDPENPAGSDRTLGPDDMANLLSGVAKVEYATVASSGIGPMSFLSGTVMLLLSRESAAIAAWFKLHAAAPWYDERFVGEISAGSLLVTVASRTVARSIALGNHDIAELHLGFLANVSPFAHGLHTIAAQRVVTMIKHMLKRLARARDEVAADNTNYAAVATMGSLEGHCTTAFDCVLAMLNGSGRNNVSLLYDLLHSKGDIFTVTSQLPQGSALAEAIAPVAKLVSYHEAELSSFAAGKPNHSVDEVLAAVRKVSDDVGVPTIVTGLSDSAKETECETTVFEYEEDENTYEYFAPLLWRGVVTSSGTVLVLPSPRVSSIIRLLAASTSRAAADGY